MWDGALNLFSGSLSGTPGAQTGKFLGKNRPVRIWGRCSGDVTGAGATCTIAFEQSATLGGTYAAVPGSPSITLTEQASIQGTTVRPEIPAPISPYAVVNPPTTGPLPSVTFTPSLDYVRANVTLAGTSPVFPAVSLNVEPIDAPSVASGR